MGHQVATIGLGPILFAQGRYVRRTVPLLPEPPGDRVGVSGTGKPLHLLVVGDSSAAGVGADTMQEALLGQVVQNLTSTFEVHWSLIARTGATSRGTLRHLQKQPSQTFDVAVTALGVNDVTAGRSVKVWIEEQNQLIDLLQTKFGVRHLILSGLPPVSHFPSLPQPLRWYLGSQAKRFDKALNDLAQNQDNCAHIQLDLPLDPNLMASDMFHPGPPVYAIWGAEAAQLICSAISHETHG
ncbi:MAG: SGNH/GDSL hydrolase family protein [Chloroflexota bacterium]